VVVYFFALAVIPDHNVVDLVIDFAEFCQMLCNGFRRPILMFQHVGSKVRMVYCLVNFSPVSDNPCEGPADRMTKRIINSKLLCPVDENQYLRYSGQRVDITIIVG